MGFSTGFGCRSDVLELSVFVYGTLKPGGRYHQRYCSRALAQSLPAVVKGCLYDFPRWGYPAMTSGEDWVKGYLLVFCGTAAVCGDILRQLDTLEGVAVDANTHEPAQNDGYQRCRQWVFAPNHQPLQKAWTYQMKREQICQFGGVYLSKGDWSIPYL
ncbi:MAG: gamma-glutamylcyclotransferase family protein [Phormidesmis sp.]